MSPKQKRLAVIAAIALLLAAAVGLVLGALRENIVFFYTCLLYTSDAADE